MARTFGGVSTDRITTTLTAHSSERSFGVWIYRTGDGGSSFGRIFDKTATNGLTEFLAYFSSTLNYTRAWSGSISSSANWTCPMPSSNDWHHVVLTYDYSSNANDPVIYVDGVSQTVTEVRAPFGTVGTTADAYVLGNRGDGTRNWAGRLEQWVVYDRLLNANEARALYQSGPRGVKGYVRWVPIWGDASPEHEFTATGATTATVTGTVKANGAPVMPFSRRLWVPGLFIPAGGGDQTLNAGTATAAFAALTATLTAAATVSPNEATAAFAAQTATATAAAAFSPAAATGTFAAQTATLTAGAVSVTSAAAAGVFTAQTATLLQEGQLAPDAAIGSFAAQTATLTAGAVTVSPAAATAAFTAQTATAAGAAVLTATPGTGTFAAQTATVTADAGAQSLEPAAAPAAFAAQTAAITAGGVTAQPAAAAGTFAGQTATLTAAVSLSPGPAAGTFAAQTAAATVGGVTVSPTPATSAFTARTATLIAPDAVFVVLGAELEDRDGLGAVLIS